MSKPSPNSMPPMDASVFWEVVNAGIRAGQQSAQAPVAVARGAPDPAANPWYGAGVAIRNIVDDDKLAFETAMSRFSALMDLYTSGALTPWIRKSQGSSDSSDIHPAVIDVAARMRLSANGRFARRKFLDRVNDQVSQWYRDYYAWPIVRETPAGIASSARDTDSARSDAHSARQQRD